MRFTAAGSSSLGPSLYSVFPQLHKAAAPDRPSILSRFSAENPSVVQCLSRRVRTHGQSRMLCETGSPDQIWGHLKLSVTMIDLVCDQERHTVIPLKWRL